MERSTYSNGPRNGTNDCRKPSIYCDYDETVDHLFIALEACPRAVKKIDQSARDCSVSDGANRRVYANNAVFLIAPRERPQIIS